MLGDLDVRILTPASLDLIFPVAETGSTYAENALLKAHAYQQASGLLTLADDSGLEVDALGGLPGLHSARFSPKPGANDADRRALLRERLEGAPRPWTARFRCVVALVTPAGQEHVFEGICPGEILPEERGHNGFGYDPCFYIPEIGKCMADVEHG